MWISMRHHGFLEREFLVTRLPHLKCIRLGSVRSSHLPIYIRLRAFKSPYINACRVNSNNLLKIFLLSS